VCRAHVDDRWPSPDGGAARFAGDTHNTRAGLNEGVIARAVPVRPAPTKGAQRTIDRAWVELPDVLEAEPLLGKTATPKRLDDNIGARGKPADDLSPFGRFNVDGDTFFVAVDGEEQRTAVAPAWRQPLAGVIAHLRPLNFDNPRAQIAQNHRTERSCQIPGHIQN
jgi:hypothetical protein